MKPREVYAQMAAGLDGNRKIMKAGRDGRDVFLWVLRQVALRGSEGRIPAREVQDADWLARVLMCRPKEASAGLKQAVAAELLRIDGDECVVVGWESEYGRRSKSGAERQAAYIARKSAEPANDSDEEVTRPSPSDAAVTVSDAVTQVSKEVRKEESKDSGARHASDEVPEPIRLLAESACAEINRLTGAKYEPDSSSTVKLCKALHASKHTPDEVRQVVADKHREWSTNPEMRRRICPSTLLALGNFEKYLDEIRSRPTAPLFSFNQRSKALT